jgi:hypothetical protein
MTSTGDSIFLPLGEGHYCLKAGPFSFEIDRLYRDRNDLTGELAVRHFTPDAPDGRVISLATFNLAALRTRQERAKHLEQRVKVPGFDVYGAIEELCQRVIDAERQGRPVTHLRDVEPPGPEAFVDVDGLLLPVDHAACLFGDGGSCKSMLALRVGGRLQQDGLRVLYADWEFSAADHRERLGLMFTAMPDILYYRAERPLVAEADTLKRMIRAERVDYVIIDSVVFALAGPPESAETAAGYFGALRALGVGSLSLAHITKAEGGDQKPFGSAFFHNGFRSTWFVQRAGDQIDPRAVRIGLFHRKTNLGRLCPALAYEFFFDESETRVGRVDEQESPDLAAKLPTWQRMVSSLRHGPKTLAALAEELGTPVGTIEQAANRGRGKRFTRVTGSDGIGRVALLDRRAS